MKKYVVLVFSVKRGGGVDVLHHKCFDSKEEALKYGQDWLTSTFSEYPVVKELDPFEIEKHERCICLQTLSIYRGSLENRVGGVVVDYIQI